MSLYNIRAVELAMFMTGSVVCFLELEKGGLDNV